MHPKEGLQGDESNETKEKVKREGSDVEKTVKENEISENLCTEIPYQKSNNVLSYYLSIDSKYLYQLSGFNMEAYPDEQKEGLSLKDNQENRLGVLSYQNVSSGYLLLEPATIESKTEFVLFKGNDKDILTVNRCDFGPGCRQFITFIQFDKEGCQDVTETIFPTITAKEIEKKIQELANEGDSAAQTLIEEYGTAYIEYEIIFPEKGTEVTLVVGTEILLEPIKLFTYTWDRNEFSIDL
ncbi:MAG: hypothetical protein LAT68_13295 [Cyclobacteriaceae bacterium]|nr:hypothetical protein [Cyclobacteriaceae bacterium]MCH8517295.1 hypothetical protein [Cyclobacteriaceae bacterium]